MILVMMGGSKALRSPKFAKERGKMSFCFFRIDA